MKKKLLIFIASPYSIGNIDENVLVQIKAAHKIMDLGHLPLYPLSAHFLNQFKSRPYDEWLELTTELLSRCDVVLRLDGVSNGADEETNLAKKLGIPVCNGWDELNEYIKKYDDTLDIYYDEYLTLDPEETCVKTSHPLIVFDTDKNCLLILSGDNTRLELYGENQKENALEIANLIQGNNNEK